MPQMANVTVKAANGTSDIIYVAMTPSSGDTTAARWRVEAASPIAGNRAAVSFTTKDNGNRTARRADINFTYPYVVEPVGGQPVVKSAVSVSVSLGLPKDIPDTDLAEAIAQFGNFVSSTLVRDSLKAGFAPT